MTATGIKSVTKTLLSGFVREHSILTLTQSKTLTDQLLAEFTVSVKPPADPSTLPVDVGQLWRNAASGRILRVTDIEMGPIYVTGDPVTSWGPQNVSWEDPVAACGAPTTLSWPDLGKNPGVGVSSIDLWRQHMILIPETEAQPAAPAPTIPESETTP